MSAYDAARATQLALVPVIAALGLARAIPVLPHRIRWATTGLAVLGLLSCMFAANSWMALREFLNLACVLALGALLAAQGVEAMRWLPKIASLAVMAYAAPVLCMALVSAAHGVPVGADLPLPGFANRRYFNHVQTVALPLAVYGVITFRSGALRVLTGFGLLASMVLLWITLGRGTLLAFAATLAVLGALCLTRRREVRSPFSIFATCFTLGGLLAAALQALAAPVGHIFSVGRETQSLDLVSDNSRFGLWARAWDMALQSPLLGAGPMHYAYGNHEKAAHPHSLPLQLLAEWGFPATLLIGLVGVWLMQALTRKLRAASGADHQLGACLIACWTAVFVDSWFSGLWVMPVSQMWLAMLLGLSWAWLSHDRVSKKPIARRWTLMPLMLSSALILHTLPELIQLSSHLESVKQAFPGEGARPRFWSHGQFGPPHLSSPR
ncbi:O-antigen ligase family protein [Roseateles sp.]|uniref:O-antigen ligase family protein n=1 Tax=Roseateles sp. TaxID=1971397 RepID=UPI00403578BA